MATYTSATAIGEREDLSDVIYRINIWSVRSKLGELLEP